MDDTEQKCRLIAEAFGNYEPGRFAWILREIRMIIPPEPARGALGLWDYPQEAHRG